MLLLLVTCTGESQPEPEIVTTCSEEEAGDSTTALEVTFLVQPYVQSVSETKAWVYWETDRGTSSRVDWGTTETLGQVACGERVPAYPGGDPDDKKWTWRWSESKVAWGIENNFIVFKQSRNGKPSVYFKEYEKVDNRCRPNVRTNPYSTLIRGCPNEKGNRELKALFNRRIFDYPKPVALIKRLLKRKYV